MPDRSSREAEPELPDELADLAAERVLAEHGAARERVLAALVAAHPGHERALRRLCADLAGAERLLDASFPEVRSEHAQEVGGHRVIRRLGEGAFGTVYLCAQERPVVRQVAIKVLRPGAGDQKTLRRFAAERQLLAALNHPAITQVFDAGELPDGRPYFVMEYVDGEPMRAYCEARGLSCNDRLRLFVELCRGVSHAHARGIVHRDLKPANVLVVDADEGPLPKIIDFGIAKALFASPDSSDQRAPGPLTDAGRVIGTPGYMSPEQAAGRVADVDARADVFALGVMLYELLTGELPWARGAAASDTEPVRPSARVTTSTSSTASAGAPSTSGPSRRRQLAAQLKGDLDWITLKALARERAERYRTVAALAADIERHLRGEPVSVGPPSLRYRLRKLVRRNRTAVLSIGAAAAILVVGLVAALAYGHAADADVVDARKAAAASFADATAVVERLLARANDPAMREAPRGDGAREALIADALSLYDRFLGTRPADPGLRAGRCRALISLSEVHWLLAETARAAESADEAVREAQALLDGDPTSLPARDLLGEALRRQGHALSLAGNNRDAHQRFVASEVQLAACAAADPAAYGRLHAAVVREAALTLPAHLTDERLDGLRASLAVLAELERGEPGSAAPPDAALQARIDVAKELCSARRFEEAAAELDRAEEDLPAVAAERDRLTSEIRRQQARVVWELGDRPKAIERCESAVAAADAWCADQPQRLTAQDTLANTLRDLGTFRNYVGAFDASTAAFRRSIAVAEAVAARFPTDTSRLVSLCINLRQAARTLWDRFRREDLDEAAAWAARATELDDRIAPTVDAGRQPRWMLLATQALIADSRGAESGELWRAVAADLATDAQTRERQDPVLLVEALTGVARRLVADGRFADASEPLAAAYERATALAPRLNKELVEIGRLEAQLALAGGDRAEAAAWADRIVAARPSWFGRRRAADCLALAWRAAAAEGADDEAADYAARAAELYAQVLEALDGDVAESPRDPWFVLPWGFAGVHAAELAAATGDATRAGELLDAALPKLEAVHAAAQADQWEQPLFDLGRTLREELAAGSPGR